jgi:hypothetical protein
MEPREEVTSLDCSQTTIQPEVGLEKADRFIHHVQWQYLWSRR